MLPALEQSVDARGAEERRQRRWRMPFRLIFIIIIAWCLGAIPSRLSASLDRQSRPAGFAMGILQGALMPMALPNLLFGRDIPIYAVNNTGVPYKLGYTTGVNVCGAMFYGFLFWRLSRWRARSGACQPASK